MWPSLEDPHIGVFALNLSEALRDQGFEVEDSAVIRGRRRGRREKVLGHLRLLGGLSRQALSGADALYVHGPSWFAPATLLSAAATSKKLIAHTHGGEVYPHSKIERWAQPAVGVMLRRADLVVAPSRYYAGELARTFQLDADRLFVSPSGGIDTQRFFPGSSTEARRQLGLAVDGPIIGYVGRLEADKGWETILETAALVVGEGRDLRVLFCGDGSDATRIDERARALGLGQRLVRLGLRPQAELPVVYRALDAFLFPTDRGAEALGLVPIEAMACGVPVLGSDRFAVPEYVLPGVTGYLAPPKDAQLFAKHLLRVLDQSGAERSAMSQACVETAAQYSAAAAAAALAQRLDQVLAR